MAEKTDTTSNADKSVTKGNAKQKPSRKHIDSNLPLNKFTNFLKIMVYNIDLTETVKAATVGALAELKQEFSNIDGVTDFTGWASVPITLIADSAGVINLLKQSGSEKGTGFDGELADYNLTKLVDTIWLPLPNNIRDSHSQKYDETSFNMEEMMMRSSLGVAKNIMSTVMPDTANTLGSVVSLAEHLAKRGNLTIDPNPLMTYAGSVPRTYTFDFLLYPTNALEAEYYKEVVAWLNYYSIVERAENNLFGELGIRTLSVRNCFTFEAVQIKNEKVKPLNFINTVMNCDRNKKGHKHGKGLIKSNFAGFFLTNTNLVLGGQDALQVYNDGAPKSGSLTLSFIERKPLWRSDWELAETNVKQSKSGFE